MTQGRRPSITVVAGPNGAGNSTLTSGLRSRPRIPVIDPDAIARELSADAREGGAIEAGREAIRRRDAYLAARESFVVETTLAGSGALRFMERARKHGFAVNLLFVGVEDAQTLVERVAGRVADGGHDVPRKDILRRYGRSMRNLSAAIRIADRATIFDNSAEGSPRRVLAVTRGRITYSASPIPNWVSTYIGPHLGRNIGR